VPGGGVAFIRARQVLEGKLQGDNQRPGGRHQIVMKRSRSRCASIVDNAGAEPSVVLNKVLENKG